MKVLPAAIIIATGVDAFMVQPLSVNGASKSVTGRFSLEALGAGESDSWQYQAGSGITQDTFYPRYQAANRVVTSAPPTTSESDEGSDVPEAIPPQQSDSWQYQAGSGITQDTFYPRYQAANRVVGLPTTTDVDTDEESEAPVTPQMPARETDSWQYNSGSGITQDTFYPRYQAANRVANTAKDTIGVPTAPLFPSRGNDSWQYNAGSGITQDTFYPRYQAANRVVTSVTPAAIEPAEEPVVEEPAAVLSEATAEEGEAMPAPEEVEKVADKA